LLGRKVKSGGVIDERKDGLDSSVPPVSGTPAFIEDDGNLPSGTGETAPFTTVPDWLSGLSPEQEEKSIKRINVSKCSP
jgi:hypothetical protein